MGLWDLRGIKRLRDLFDVLWGTPSNGDVLTYDSTEQKAKWGAAGAGDMVKSTYDPNNDGVVADSDKLGGQLPGYYRDAGNLNAGTVPDARFPATLPAASGANLTNLNASNLASGTVPDARFPATLPAASGANLTNLNAGNLASGTVPDSRFPATLPAVSGANLTNLNAGNLASGTVPVGRLGNTIVFRSDINNFTGGTSADLDGLATASMPVGTLLYFTVATDNSVALYCLQDAGLLPAESSPSIIRPDTTDGSKYWQLVLRVNPSYTNPYSTAPISGASIKTEIPAAVLSNINHRVGWISRDFDQIFSGSIGYSPYRHPSLSISADGVKSASASLQTATLRGFPIRVPFGFAAYKTTGAMSVWMIADSNSSSNVKVTGITLKGSNNLTSWTTIYTDTTARTPATADTAEEISINRSSFLTTTVFDFYAVEVSVQAANSKTIAILSARIFAE